MRTAYELWTAELNRGTRWRNRVIVDALLVIPTELKTSSPLLNSAMTYVQAGYMCAGTPNVCQSYMSARVITISCVFILISS